MRKARRVKTADAAAQANADFQKTKQTPLLVRRNELIEILRRSEPFSFLLGAFKRFAVKEIAFLVRGNDQSHSAVVFDDLFGPAENLFPVFSAFLLKEIVPVFSDDILDSLSPLRIERVSKERHDVALIGRKVHVFNRSLSRIFVNKFYLRAVFRGRSNNVRHMFFLLRARSAARKSAAASVLLKNACKLSFKLRFDKTMRRPNLLRAESLWRNRLARVRSPARTTRARVRSLRPEFPAAPRLRRSRLRPT